MPFCGTKQITLGIHDGFGINGWSQASFAAVRSEAAKCANVKQVVIAGRRRPAEVDLRRQRDGRAGRDAITIIPDFGKSQLPSLQARDGRRREGRAVGRRSGGVDGKDFVAYVDWDDATPGRRGRNWMVKALHGKGNVVFTGGPAGNPVSADSWRASSQVFNEIPEMKLLTGTKTGRVTNWDPATAQKIDGALLAKYPKIDGII